MPLQKGECMTRIESFFKTIILLQHLAELKKYIWNAVEVGMAKALCEALARKLIELKSIAA